MTKLSGGAIAGIVIAVIIVIIAIIIGIYFGVKEHGRIKPVPKPEPIEPINPVEPEPEEPIEPEPIEPIEPVQPEDDNEIDIGPTDEELLEQIKNKYNLNRMPNNITIIDDPRIFNPENKYDLDNYMRLINGTKEFFLFLKNSGKINNKSDLDYNLNLLYPSLNSTKYNYLENLIKTDDGYDLITDIIHYNDLLTNDHLSEDDFDPQFYLSNYGDIADAWNNPENPFYQNAHAYPTAEDWAIAHYMGTGKEEGRLPNEGKDKYFSPWIYLAKYSDIQSAWDNSLYGSRNYPTAEDWATAHYMGTGKGEGRNTIIDIENIGKLNRYWKLFNSFMNSGYENIYSYLESQNVKNPDNVIEEMTEYLFGYLLGKDIDYSDFSQKWINDVNGIKNKYIIPLLYLAEN